MTNLIGYNYEFHFYNCTHQTSIIVSVTVKASNYKYQILQKKLNCCLTLDSNSVTASYSNFQHMKQRAHIIQTVILRHNNYKPPKLIETTDNAFTVLQLSN